MEYKNLLALIKRRRSIRAYKPEPIPIETVMQVLEAARWAPSGTNSQPWEFIVVRDRDKLDQVMEVLIETAQRCREFCLRFSHLHYEGLRNVSTFIIVCADTRFISTYPQSDASEKLQSMYQENSERILIQSVAAATIYLNLAAFSLGLGTLWSSGVSESIAEQKLRKVLDIPKELQVLCCLPLGYTTMRPHSGVYASTRCPRPLETMVHLNKFDKRKWRNKHWVAKFSEPDRRAWAKFFKTGRID